MKPGVAPAAAADAGRWAAMRCALWPDESLADSHAEVARYFAGGFAHIRMAFLARDGDEIVGFAELGLRTCAEGCDSSPVPFLEGWYVEPAHRRRGVGSALVRACAEWARAQGYSEIGSDAVADNVDGIAAHLATGFEDVETVRCFRKPL